jgi:hypothetical protein
MRHWPICWKTKKPGSGLSKNSVPWTWCPPANRLVKKHFNAAGIELPYPHTVLYFGQDKKGNTPPIPIRDAGNMRNAVEGQA